jgi:hypothetical protein
MQNTDFFDILIFFLVYFLFLTPVTIGMKNMLKLWDVTPLKISGQC